MEAAGFLGTEENAQTHNRDLQIFCMLWIWFLSWKVMLWFQLVQMCTKPPYWLRREFFCFNTWTARSG